MASSTWSTMSRWLIVPVRSSSLSARDDLPWSMCAMMQKLRMRARGVAIRASMVSRQSGKLAVDDVNARGGVNGYKLDIVVQDDATDVNKAVENTRELILQEQVVALIGSVTSAQCQAETPIAKQNKVLTIAATCNSY